MNAWKSPIVIHQGVAVEPENVPSRPPKKNTSRRWWVAGAVVLAMGVLAWRMSIHDEATAIPQVAAATKASEHSVTAGKQKPVLPGRRSQVFAKMGLAGMKLKPLNDPEETYTIEGLDFNASFVGDGEDISTAIVAMGLSQPEYDRAIMACNQFLAAATNGEPEDGLRPIAAALRVVSANVRKGDRFPTAFTLNQCNVIASPIGNAVVFGVAPLGKD